VKLIVSGSEAHVSVIREAMDYFIRDLFLGKH